MWLWPGVIEMADFEVRRQILIKKTDPDTGLPFQDAIYMSEDEYQAIEDKDKHIQALVEVRFSQFKVAVQAAKDVPEDVKADEGKVSE